MNKNFLYLILSISVLCLVACSDDDCDIIIEQPNVMNEPQEYTFEDSCNIDTMLYYIESEQDIQELLLSKSIAHEKYLSEQGWTKIEESTYLPTRAVSVRVDTIYKTSYTVDTSDPNAYDKFKVKFSQAIVDSINAVVDSKYKISKKKTYLCEWRLFSATIKLEQDEEANIHESPWCALKPSQRDTYTNRGYAPFKSKTASSNSFRMESYQLFIKYENKKGAKTVLDIGWPFFKKFGNGAGTKGYEFIYSVKKRI